ncbi:hypothetical protein CONLIGDRAFT_682846 [Coniochaeta ligniaria NRRL 30616]|uniref:Rhodopsin domain-containing protein n=1 Tax=Coniochaeta ligniaria NRRL 30616 TaxID=1408157 RepID=A0A1J7JDN4_9PEZI|nr:hypothetical protein CONLIGDRAFT_682846 [Coniochaeta ligniaria NRRL 30616]
MTVRKTLGPLMAAFVAIDIIIVLGRLIVRKRLNRLEYDDYAIVVALVGFVVMCSFCFVSLAYGFGTSDPAVIATISNYNAMEASRYFTIAQITYVAGFPVVRISVALVLHRIVNGMARLQRALVASMVFVGVYALGCILVDAFQCIPLKAVWGDGTGRCLSSSQLAGLAFAVSALDIASALLYAVLPVFLLKGLQLGKRTKAAIMCLLGLGGGTVVISLVRLRTLVLLVHSSDVAHSLDLELESFIYSVLEFGISILTASLVAFRPLLKYLPFGTRGHSSGRQGRSDGLNSGNPAARGTNRFELSRRDHRYTANGIRLDSDDAESERDILRDATGVWKQSDVTVSFETKANGTDGNSSEHERARI